MRFLFAFVARANCSRQLLTFESIFAPALFVGVFCSSYLLCAFAARAMRSRQLPTLFVRVFAHRVFSRFLLLAFLVRVWHSRQLLAPIARLFARTRVCGLRELLTPIACVCCSQLMLLAFVVRVCCLRKLLAPIARVFWLAFLLIVLFAHVFLPSALRLRLRLAPTARANCPRFYLQVFAPHWFLWYFKALPLVSLVSLVFSGFLWYF